MTGDLPPLRDVIAEFGLAPRKSLGQHFLLDLNITRKIVRAAQVEPGDVVYEVGPGPGGLTRALLEAGARVTAVERDRRSVEALGPLATAYRDRLAVVEGDALQTDERAILPSTPAAIVSNLPYNVGTELLIKWLHANANGNAGAPLWSRMALMFQKEVADRILAAPGTKAYGRLTVIAQTAATPARAFNLPASAFTPPPKVDSTVVLFSPATAPPRRLASLEAVTQHAFSQRRKMLRTSLKPVFGDRLGEALAEVGLSPELRAETVPPTAYVALAEIANAVR